MHGLDININSVEKTSFTLFGTVCLPLLPTSTKLTLASQILLKNVYAEFDENPAVRFSRWYTSQMDGLFVVSTYAFIGAS